MNFTGPGKSKIILNLIIFFLFKILVQLLLSLSNFLNRKKKHVSSQDKILSFSLHVISCGFFMRKKLRLSRNYNFTIFQQVSSRISCFSVRCTSVDIFTPFCVNMHERAHDSGSLYDIIFEPYSKITEWKRTPV